MGEDKNNKATDPRLVLMATAVSVALFLVPVCVSAEWGAGFAEGLPYGIGAVAAFSLLSGLLKRGRQGFEGREITRHAAVLARILQVVVVLVPPAALIVASQTKPSSQAFLWGGLLVVIIVAASAFLLWRRAARS